MNLTSDVKVVCLPSWFNRQREPACNTRDAGSIPGSGRSPGGGHGNPLQLFVPGKLHGQRSLAGYGSRVAESGTTEVTGHSMTHSCQAVGASLVAQWQSHLQCRRCVFEPWVRKIPREGNGNPLQHSCLGSPMGAPVYGISRVEQDLVTKPPPPSRL